MWPFDRNDKAINELIDKEYESIAIGLCKWYSDEKEKSRQLLASKGQSKDILIKSMEFKILIEFVKKQSDAYCKTILKYHTNPNRAISESNKIKYQERLESILGQINEDLQSVNIVKDEARYKFESIYSKVNFDTKEECDRIRKDTLLKPFIIGIFVLVVGTLIVAIIMNYFKVQQVQ